ncbi:BTAD domain-containing putative transcriptional regulator [Amycolatopsis nigrescens]|uniref:BTAD domain-containing putative transcriptional regulator n=1 Tax=Amycolatopsis nigrescens TaxID=381445 RepID=UPI001B7FA3DA|nr:BTAD domain-containing putative transcriptional regulator [Amycolatopsis nigrescens]
MGPVEAIVAGRLVDLGTPKQRALLALLVSRAGQPVAVDVMLEALWAGHPPPSATTSLQAYVANLRRVLEPDRAPRKPATVLRTLPQGYLLDGRVVDVDVDHFGAHATAGWQAWDRGDPQQALSEFDAGLALWRGQAYAEVAHATWVAPEVARLEELRLSVVEVRCAALLAVGAHEVAGAELEAFIQAHPLREYGCELLSLALYRAGRQADALEVLRTLQMRLVEELGIDPRPALKHLEHEILNQAPALDWHATKAAPTMTVPTAPKMPAPPIRADGPPPSPVVDGEVFVGREPALRQLGDALAAAAAGRGRVVTVSGEPGVGKTSLLRCFAKLAGVPVLWGTCPEHVAAPPLWLWEQVLRAVGTCFPQRSIPVPVTELLDRDGHRPEDGVDAAGATLRQFEAIVQYLTDASHTAPLVVLLDHLHRADPSSLRLLAHLAESVPASRLLLAVSYRSDEAAPLAGTLAALARAGMTRIELSGLDTQDTRVLVSALLPHEVSEHTAERLWARTEGNPFFLRELIKPLTADQCLDQSHPAPVPIPVREVLLQRIARLPRAAAEMLSVAAIAGRHFDIEVVAEAASVELEAALEILDTAVAGGLIVEDQRLGWFRFTHALAAEALYETTGRLRRARLHRRIGAAAARAWAGNAERAAEVARHWLLAAELDPTAAAQAATHAATAAKAAEARLAPEDATALWRQALAAADLAGQERHDRHHLLIGLGTSLYRAGNPREGLPVFIQAMEEILAAKDADRVPDTARLVNAAVTAVSDLNWYPVGYGEVDERLVDVLERALSLVTEPAHRALLLSSLAVARYHDDDPERRAALSDEALDLAWRAADKIVLGRVLHLRATALSGPDYHDERVQAGAEMLALPGLPPALTVRARQLRAQVLVASGHVSDASAELDLAAKLVDERNAPLRAQLAWSRAGLRSLDGCWREAEELSRAAYDLHARMSWGDAKFNRMVQRWEAAYLVGDGRDLVDELRAFAGSTDLPALHSILVMALTEAGQVHDARLALRRFPHEPKDYLWLYTRCWALLAAARLRETELVTRFRAQLLPYRRLACSIADFAISGPVAYFTAEAAMALGDQEAAMADLAVATDLAQRMDAGPWLAQVRAAICRCAGSGAEPCAGKRAELVSVPAAGDGMVLKSAG